MSYSIKSMNPVTNGSRSCSFEQDSITAAAMTANTVTSPTTTSTPSSSRRRFGVDRQIVDDFAAVVNYVEQPEDFFEKAVEGAVPQEVDIIQSLLEATTTEPTTLPTADDLGISEAEIAILTGDALTKRLVHGASTPTSNMYTMDFIAHVLAPFRNPQIFAYNGNAPFFLAGTDAGTFKPDFFAGVAAFPGVVCHSGNVGLPVLFMGKAEGNPDNDFFRVAIWQAQAISHQERFLVDFSHNTDPELMPCKLPFSAALFVDGSMVTVSVFLVVRYKLRWIVFKPIDCLHSRNKLLRVLHLLLNHVKLWVSTVEGIRDGKFKQQQHSIADSLLSPSSLTNLLTTRPSMSSSITSSFKSSLASMSLSSSLSSSSSSSPRVATAPMSSSSFSFPRIQSSISASLSNLSNNLPSSSSSSVSSVLSPTNSTTASTIPATTTTATATASQSTVLPISTHLFTSSTLSTSAPIHDYVAKIYVAPPTTATATTSSATTTATTTATTSTSSILDEKRNIDDDNAKESTSDNIDNKDNDQVANDIDNNAYDEEWKEQQQPQQQQQDPTEMDNRYDTTEFHMTANTDFDDNEDGRVTAYEIPETNNEVTNNFDEEPNEAFARIPVIGQMHDHAVNDEDNNINIINNNEEEVDGEDGDSQSNNTNNNNINNNINNNSSSTAGIVVSVATVTSTSSSTRPESALSTDFTVINVPPVLSPAEAFVRACRKMVFKDPSCYRLHKNIHKSPASTVFEATLVFENAPIVVKIVPYAFYKRAVTEINILKKQSIQNSPYIVRLLGHFQTANADTHILFQRIPCKSNHFKPCSAEEMMLYMRTLLESLLHLHEHNVIHADIKESNCLFDSNLRRVVLIDFGLASHGPVFYGSRGSQGYASPEMHVEGNRLTSAVDVYSSGIIFCNMMFNWRVTSLNDAMAIANARTLEQAKQITLQNCEYGVRERRKEIQTMLCSQDAFDLLKEMLMHDAISRITVKEALNHPYFTGVKGPARPRRRPPTASVTSLKATLSGHAPHGFPVAPFHPGTTATPATTTATATNNNNIRRMY